MSVPNTQGGEKKLLNQSPLTGYSIPIAVILVSALLLFGITKMLSSGKNHRDLVEELTSKTFGNRWVAAFELSKYLAGSKIPAEDKPWMVENLKQVYLTSEDARTRNFIILALGALQEISAYDFIHEALNDEDSQVRYSALVVLGNAPMGAILKWDIIEPILQKTDDPGLTQVAILTIATHNHPNAKVLLEPFLNYSNIYLKYAAAIALVPFNSEKNGDLLLEIASLDQDKKHEAFNGAQVEALKLSLLSAIQKNPTEKLMQIVHQKLLVDANIKVSTKSQELVNLLKK